MSCSGVPEDLGSQAAVDITEEFAQHRPWFSNVTCKFESGRLVLTAESDVDQHGLALTDEFSDCLCAYLAPFDDDGFGVESVTEIDS
jgi:hypothetical protein